MSKTLESLTISHENGEQIVTAVYTAMVVDPFTGVKSQVRSNPIRIEDPTSPEFVEVFGAITTEALQRANLLELRVQEQSIRAETAESKVHGLEDEISSLKTQSESQQELVSTLENTIAANEQKMSEAAKQLEDNRVQLDQLNAEVDRLLQDQTDMKRTHEEALQNETSKVNTLQNNLNAAQQSIALLDQQNADLRTSERAAVRKLAELEALYNGDPNSIVETGENESVQ